MSVGEMNAPHHDDQHGERGQAGREAQHTGPERRQE